MSGVGNVGDFHKTFFVGECAYIGFHPSFSALGIAQASLALLSLNENVSGEQKHRTSLHKSSVLLRQNLRTFAQRSPMFLISEVQPYKH